MYPDNNSSDDNTMDVYFDVSNQDIIRKHYLLGDMLHISPNEHRALLALWQHGELTAGDVATLTNLTTGAVTGLIDRLEKRGLVKREHDTTDRRRVTIDLTTEGDSIIKQYYA